MKTKPLVAVLSLLLLSGIGCGVGGPVTHRNNDIRRAALDYEMATRGGADEVLVAFGYLEVRDNLGFQGGNTVWLNPVAQAEYFRDRDEGRSYIFLRGLAGDNGVASITVDRADAEGVESWQLSLRRDQDGSSRGERNRQGIERIRLPLPRRPALAWK